MPRFSLRLLLIPMMGFALAACDSALQDGPPTAAAGVNPSIVGPTTLGELCTGTYTLEVSIPGYFAITSGAATIVSQTPPTQTPHVAQIMGLGSSFTVGWFKSGTSTPAYSLNVNDDLWADCG